MKITRITPFDNTPPFNPIFERYPTTLHRLLEERKEVIVEGPATTYVPMPEAEQDILNFTRARSGALGFVVGAIGIGKSSVLKKLRLIDWPQEGCLVVFRDFSQDDEFNYLPDDYWRFERLKQKQCAFAAARRVIFDMIHQKLIQIGGATITSENARDFYSFVYNYFPRALGSISTFPPETDAECLKRLRSLQRKRKGVFTEILLAYVVQNKGYNHVKILIDNIDDKDLFFVAGLASTAARLARTLHTLSLLESKIGGNGTVRRQLTPLIACRPETAFHLENEKLIEGHKWHGQQGIPIARPISLVDIVSKRYTLLQEEAKSDNRLANELRADVVFESGGKKWVVSDRRSFFVGICTTFQHSGQTDDLVSLCNYNVADSMKAMLEVVRNLHFVHINNILGDVWDAYIGQKSNIDLANPKVLEENNLFTRTTVIRALAYGNQGSVANPIYPIRGTRIPCLIHSEVGKLGESVAKPRILDLLALRDGLPGGGDRNYTVSQIVELIEEFRMASREQTITILDEMFSEGLLSHVRGLAPPSIVGPDCPISISPRGRFLRRTLTRDSILLQCYRDTTFLNSHVTWRSRSPHFRDIETLSMSIVDTAVDLFWMAVQSWDYELKLGNRVFLTAPTFVKFRNLFGERFVSEQMLEGIEGSRRFFERYDDGRRCEALFRDIQALRSEINERTEFWLNR